MSAYTYENAIARLAELELPEDLAIQDGGSDAEHFEWLCTASDADIRSWASWFIAELNEINERGVA